MAETHTTNDIDKLVELLDGIRFTMFTSRAGDRLHARPMTTLGANGGESLWFFTTRDSELIDEIRTDPTVCLTYSDTGSARYVSVSGMAAAREDQARVEQLWNPLVKAWFQGPDDPALQLLEVRIEAAEYWDGQSSRLVRLAGIAKAAVTGDRYDAGEQGVIELGAGEGASAH